MDIGPLQNPRWEAYCRERAAGKTQCEAVLSAYPKYEGWKRDSLDKCGQRLEKRPQVRARIDALLAAAAEHAVITRAEVIDGMARTFRLAQDADGLNQTAVNAVSSIGRTLLQALPPEHEDAAAEHSADYAMLIAPPFLAMHRDVASHPCTDYDLPGGRGSGKSSTVALEIPRILDMVPDGHAVCFRKVANTLRTSVYAKMVWALSQLGRSGEFSFSVSPMEIVRKSTGQKIYFFGINEPEKYKSFSPPFGRVAVEWFEEADQFAPDEIRSVNQTFTRGQGDVWRFRSWNPPRSHSNWINREAKADLPGRRLYASSYLDVPEEWLGAQFLADAETLREVNETAYRHEYLGEDVGTDGEVFQNVQVREITQEERDSFRWVRRGVDWGYAVDPWVFLSVAYDGRTRTVYIFDEAFGQRLSDEQTTARAKQLMTETGEDGNPVFLPRKPINTVLADAADPKSIASWNALGVHTVAAPKWPGSVDAGIHWLQTRTAIVIDRSCMLAAQEFSAYEYQDGGDGRLKTYPDRDNHTIDACRYALSPVIADKRET